MIKNHLTIITLFFVLFSQAQEEMNLVKNPSFEELKGKLKSTGGIESATGWSSNTPEKADLFSKDKQGLPISVPSNSYGNEEPEDGKNYAGIFAYSYGNKGPRTYITGELSEPLQEGQMYCVKFYVSLADLSKYAVNNLSAYLTKKPPTRDVKTDIILEKEEEKSSLVFHPTNQVFNARYNWEPVCGVYMAKGKEDKIVIGNFKNNIETKYDKMKKLEDVKGTQIADAYYYIDNVQVFRIDSLQQCNCMIKKVDAELRTTIIYNKTVSSDGALSLEQKIENSTIYFDNLNSKIDPSMIRDLDALVKIMEENPNLRLEVKGHKDGEETREGAVQAKYQMLDKDRIDEVLSYLVNKGVDRSRFTLRAIGSQEPADKDETELAKAKNRRVEFIIIK
ncbi:MAG: OmpA family protein [Bacteroidia bacterium]